MIEWNEHGLQFQVDYDDLPPEKFIMSMLNPGSFYTGSVWQRLDTVNKAIYTLTVLKKDLIDEARRSS